MQVCNEPGCTAWSETAKCPACTSAKRRRSDSHRASSAGRGYNARWQGIRARYIRAHPLCECVDCLMLPLEQRPAAVDVDHRDGSGPRGDNRDANLCAMAHGHHSRKTALDDGGFGRRRASR